MAAALSKTGPAVASPELLSHLVTELSEIQATPRPVASLIFT